MGLALGLLAAMAGLLAASETAAQAVREGLALCGGSVIPALFPFLVVSRLFVATGSAAAALGAFLHRLQPAASRFTLFQGRHIGRPSEIAIEIRDGAVWIGGPCAAFAQGELAQ